MHAHAPVCARLRADAFHVWHGAALHPARVFCSPLASRNSYYPFFWAKNEMDKLRDFAPRFQQIYFLHNFKGSTPAVLFRAYPGPFQVLLRTSDGTGFSCVHETDTFPGLRAVAADILPAAIAKARAASRG
jgi:hypothetical protein